MTKHPLSAPTLCFMVAMATIVACDNGAATGSGVVPDADCPIGTFRPVAFADCVFPADDLNGVPIETTDNRCETGQPATPPSCVGESGQRAYLSATTACAQGYRFEPGTCDRDSGAAGAAGSFTGDAGAPFITGGAGETDTSGAAGALTSSDGGD